MDNLAAHTPSTSVRSLSRNVGSVEEEVVKTKKHSLAAIYPPSPSKGGACPPNTPVSSQQSPNRSLSASTSRSVTPIALQKRGTFPQDRSGHLVRRKPQRHTVFRSSNLRTQTPKEQTAIVVPERVSSKILIPLSQRSSLSFGGDLTADGDTAPTSTIKSRISTISLNQKDSLSPKERTSLPSAAGTHAYPIATPLPLNKPPRPRLPRRMSVRSRTHHTSSKGGDDFSQDGVFRGVRSPRRPIAKNFAALTVPRASISVNDEPSGVGRRDTGNGMHDQIATAPNNLNAEPRTLAITKSGCLPLTRQSSSDYETDSTPTELPNGGRCDVSDIISLYLALSKSPSARSLLATPPRHATPVKRSIASGATQTRRPDLAKATAILEQIRQYSITQRDLERDERSSLIDSQPVTRRHTRTEDNDSSTDSDDVLKSSTFVSRKGSTASGPTATRQWLHEWLTKRLSISNPSDPEDNLTARPMYRRARKQASSEDTVSNVRLRRAPMDGSASRDTGTYSPVDSQNTEAKPDIESIERVIRGLEHVLQEAVQIAEQASPDLGSVTGRSSTASSPVNICYLAPKTDGESKVTEATNDVPPEISRPGQPKSKKKSTDFPDFINEYHRTLTWLSTKPRSSATTPRPYSTPTLIEEPDPIEEVVVALGKQQDPEPPNRFPLRSRGIKSQRPSRDTDTSVSPFTCDEDVKYNSLDQPGNFPIPSARPKGHDKLSSRVVSRDFAIIKASNVITTPTPHPKAEAKLAAIDPHKPADQRVRYSEESFVPEVPDAFSPTPAQTSAEAQTRAEEATPPVGKHAASKGRWSDHPHVQPRKSSQKFGSRKARRRKGYPDALEASKDDRPRSGHDFEKNPFVIDSGQEDNGGTTYVFKDSGGGFSPGQGLTKAPVTASRAPVPKNTAKAKYDVAHKGRDGQKTDADIKYDLKAFQHGLRRHHSFSAHGHFSLHRAHRRSAIARDWSTKNKRFTATVACISTSLIGLIIGIYAGQVPAIQYMIVDEDTHYAILGNVFFYLGLAVTTATAWPLPLLFGRKRFTLGALGILLPLQFPQALVVMQQRVPYVSVYRIGLLVPRALSGLVIGLANMNFLAILLDLFGASLQSGNPHQEVVIEHDPRRHGGGMGVWLSIWTWCHIGSIGVGFLIGAVIIGYLNVSWGFWIVIFATLAVLLLNIASPETRRSTFRNSVAEVKHGTQVSRRVGRGEVMMHLYAEGPLHWWEEVRAGSVLSIRMLKQAGFAILVFYQGWIYGQVVMVMILLGALASRYYYLHPQYVALCVASFPLGALMAVPFQKASLFSRSRHHAQRTDSMTFNKRVSCSSHLVRRIVFMVSLPVTALVYTFSSGGPPTPLALPVVFSIAIGFLTNLALCECYGIIMETFDTSDLQPGMTGRPRNDISEDVLRKRTNFSCFPRVTAGFAVVQTASFIVAAAATAIGGSVERNLGAEAATGVVAGVLVALTLLLIAALTRFRSVQIVPTGRADTTELMGPGENLPVIIGNPSGTTRRISLLELGNMSRWTEIRRRNHLMGSGRHGRYE